MDNEKSVLVVYYSRTGFCQSLAKEIADGLGGELLQLEDTKNRSGVLGFIAAGKDAATGKDVPCKPINVDVSKYDMVVVGTPVWANTMATAVKSFLSDHGSDIRSVGLYCCTRHSGIEQTLRNMAAYLKCPTKASSGFLEKQVKKGQHTQQMAGFLEQLRAVD